MAINIDQQRIEEYEGAADWSSGSNLTPTGAPDWTPPVYAEGEEPPLQWLLDAALPLLIGGGAGAAVVGRKKIAQEAVKAINKIKKTKPVNQAVPFYNKVGEIVGKDKRAVVGGINNPSIKAALEKVNPQSVDVNILDVLSKIPKESASLNLPSMSHVRYLASLPKAAKESYKASRVKEQKDLARRLKESIKNSEKYHRTALKDFPELEKGSKWGSAWRYGVPSSGTKQEYKAPSHAFKSMKKSNPELQKRTADKIIDYLLGID